MLQKQYEEFIKNVQLTNIKLTNLSCENNEEFSGSAAPLEIALNYEISRIKVKNSKINFYLDFGIFPFVQTESFEGSQQDSAVSRDQVSDDQVAFEIDLQLELTYSIDEKKLIALKEGNKEDLKILFEQEIKEFSSRNVPVNAWPYVRELVSSLTTRMGYPPLLIPLFLQFAE
ncbi:protein-export chaperone SecB [Priestia aryabhattai]